MSVEVVVALISAGVAVCSAVVTAYTTARSIRLQHALTLRRAELDRQEASEDLVRCYREPLLLAAFDLHARICNIVQDGFLSRHLASADPQEQQYARVSTLYRVGDYFGWTETLRRGLQFMDLGDDRKTRELTERLALVSRTFSDTRLYPAGAFRSAPLSQAVSPAWPAAFRSRTAPAWPARPAPSAVTFRAWSQPLCCMAKSAPVPGITWCGNP